MFADELGATLLPGAAGLDVDAFDAYCDHLIVREDSTGEVVGTYRLLPPEAHRAGGYAEDEFDLSPLDPLRDDLVEAGRSCVHPDHRSGAVINLMWAGITRYLHLRGSRWLGGCASVPVADGGRTVAGVWSQAQRPAPVAAAAAGPPVPALARRAGCRPARSPPAAGRDGSRCRRCCAATCGSARGSAASRRTTRDFGVRRLLRAASPWTG